MLLKYFYNDKLAHASYMVGCQRTGEAMIIDPGRDVQPYLQEAEANGMTIVGAVETHIHADYVSGARELAAQAGATLYLSDEGGEGWTYQFLDSYSHKAVKDGDQFWIGNLRFDVLHTPGHTPEHISLLLTDTGGGADKPMGIFTGDFVFVGSVGRPDLLEKAAGIGGTAVSGAKQQFASLQRFKQLPDYLQLWPGHGAGSACGKGLGAVPSSTVGYEKMFNPALAYVDEAEFVAYLLADQPEPPHYFKVMKQVNKGALPLLAELPTVEMLPDEQLVTLLAAGAQVVDTRAVTAFGGCALPGTINIPQGMLAGWAGWLVDYERPLYLLADAPNLPAILADLRSIGVDQVVGAWETAVVQRLADAGHAVQSYSSAKPMQLKEQILQGDVTLIDVRNRSEFAAGHLPNANHIMLGHLRSAAASFINGKPIVVQCQSGVRSAVGASILQSMGATEVINLKGGYLGWNIARLPVEKGNDA